VSEFRQDPITGHWTIIAEGRGVRPNEYGTPSPPPPSEGCPFCSGNETGTPPEIAAYRTKGSRPNTPGWSVRTIPNKFPTVFADAPTGPTTRAPGEVRRPGIGRHEVVIVSPAHAGSLSNLPMGQAREVFRMLRERMRALASEPGIRGIVAFENAGPESGGSLFHPHAQIVAVPEVPPLLADEAAGAARYSRTHGGVCAFETEIARERESAVRVVIDTPEMLVYAPFASPFPFEVRLLPFRHAGSLGGANDVEIHRLAELLPQVLRALSEVVPGASYNFVTRAFPWATPEDGAYHWHLDVLPRLVRPDGFDVGSGIPVNPVAPEAAADQLRRAIASTARSSGGESSRP